MYAYRKVDSGMIIKTITPHWVGNKAGGGPIVIDSTLTSANESLNSPHASALQQFQEYKKLLNNMFELLGGRSVR